MAENAEGHVGGVHLSHYAAVTSEREVPFPARPMPVHVLAYLDTNLATRYGGFIECIAITVSEATC